MTGAQRVDGGVHQLGKQAGGGNDIERRSVSELGRPIGLLDEIVNLTFGRLRWPHG
jgi:hypothetical protein